MKKRLTAIIVIIVLMMVSTSGQGAWAVDGNDTAPAVQTGIKVLVNGSQVQFDQPPIMENGRTLVPTRAVAESFGASVGWNSATQTVIITE